MAYQGYPGNPELTPPYGGPVDPMYTFYQAVAGASGTIDSDELHRLFSTNGYPYLSHRTCKTLITMLDRDYSGNMGFNEFKELFTAINSWNSTFMQSDTDRSGFISKDELHKAFNNFGYRVSVQFSHFVASRYDPSGMQGLTLDNFISACIALRSLTGRFQQRDYQRNGTMEVQYDDFMQIAVYHMP